MYLQKNLRNSTNKINNSRLIQRKSIEINKRHEEERSNFNKRKEVLTQTKLII